MKKMFLKLFLFCLWRLDVVFGAKGFSSMLKMEGDSVTLSIGSNDMKNGNQIRWWFGKYLLAEINVNNDSITVYDDVADERFRDRLKVDDQTGSLIITNIRTEHAGDYRANS
ncbi:hypothetical protein PO909_028121, partial [Leuciscus waleckii]